MFLTIRGMLATMLSGMVVKLETMSVSMSVGGWGVRNHGLKHGRDAGDHAREHVCGQSRPSAETS